MTEPHSAGFRIVASSRATLGRVTDLVAGSPRTPRAWNYCSR